MARSRSKTAAAKRGRNSVKRGSGEERAVARIYGGTRRKRTGEKLADVYTEEKEVEVKSHQRSTPQWWQHGWEQAVHSATLNGREPELVASFVDGGKRRRWRITLLPADPGLKES